ncbi:MAG TPA: glycosyltransferase family 2 protein [Anaerolineales bacterium]|nr:glycosyltransferase family 2 protein [Anaerolineales bacterium]HNA90272.1 glycosyltransferase family 2 protein [Anaerolineales bacterium]HNB37117.1 glycosyltransferase family 2 protein [Anaerolineales bacterium]HNC09455.1 glycosyltransferase family 2 protein [Anaerolineales bacterium]
MTLVSIITPSYNQASYLEQTIRSVLEQDYPRIEYIVMDGASTDGSVEIIRKFESRLVYWESVKDAGQADAINKGFARATGEIVAWLNSDDYYLPGTVGKAVKIFEENPDVVLVYGDMLAVDEHGKTFNTLNYKQLTLEDLLCFQIIGQPAVFMRRSALQKASGLNLTFHFLLDHLLWIQIAKQGRILHVDQTWSAARYHAEAKNVAKAAEFGREAFRILETIAQDKDLAATLHKIDRRAHASAYRVDARYLLDGGLPGQALSAWFRALFIYPPVALKRMNIFVSAVLNGLGLGKLRETVLQQRKKKLSG